VLYYFDKMDAYPFAISESICGKFVVLMRIRP